MAFAGVTAERGRSLTKGAVAAQAAMQEATAAAKAKKRLRDAEEKKLRKAMGDIVAILPCVIAKSDPRWLEFGLKQPHPRPAAARFVRGHAPVAEPVEVDFRPVEQSSEIANTAA